MLVATANWGLGDGSLAAAPAPDVFVRLSAELHRAALRAGFRGDGRYRPIERVGIVLAGDTFDGMVSDRWLDAVRPWEHRRQAVARHEEVLRAAWRAARRHLGWIVRLARLGLVVPPADRHGRPVVALRVRVPVQVVVLVGDRDAALARLGGSLAGPQRTIGVGSVWEGNGVRVAHGAACDPLHACEGEPTLLQSLAVDLLARFAAAFRARPALAGRGRRIARLLIDAAPLDMPQRLGAAFAVLTEQEAVWIAGAWRRAVDRWGREARRLGCAAESGVVDAVAGWMHACDGSAPSAAIGQVIEALRAPLPLPDRSDARLVVMGHPGHGCPLAGERGICLGPPSVAPSPGGRAGTTAVACVETYGAASPARLRAAAILEPDEGPGAGSGWWSLADGWEPAGIQPLRSPILDAA